MEKHFYLALVLLLACAGSISAYFVLRRRISLGKRSLWDYLLIWPLFIKQNSDREQSSGLFSSREWMGWLVVFVLALSAVIFGWGT
jgi:hypothetical protein